MPITRVIVLSSFLLSSGLIVTAVFATTGMRGSLLPGRESELTGNAAAAIVLATVCGWPWFMAFRKAATMPARLGANIFSVVSVLAAAAVHSPIRTAPAEGVGYYVIFFVLAVWVVGPFLLRIRASEGGA